MKTISGLAVSMNFAVRISVCPLPVAVPTDDMCATARGGFSKK